MLLHSGRLKYLCKYGAISCNVDYRDNYIGLHYFNIQNVTIDCFREFMQDFINLCKAMGIDFIYYSHQKRYIERFNIIKQVLQDNMLFDSIQFFNRNSEKLIDLFVLDLKNSKECNIDLKSIFTDSIEVGSIFDRSNCGISHTKNLYDNMNFTRLEYLEGSNNISVIKIIKDKYALVYK